jgi:hypothetical protein
MTLAPPSHQACPTAPGQVPSATLRTRVTVPLRFPDGYSTPVEDFTCNGLVDDKEHLLLGLGDWRTPCCAPHSPRALILAAFAATAAPR